MPSAPYGFTLHDAPKGACRLYLSFASDRSQVEAVALEPALERFVDLGTGIWRSPQKELKRGKLALRVSWRGEPPQIAAVVARPAAEASAEARATQALKEVERKACRALLEERAGRRFAKWQRETRFLMRFDAWTNPPVLVQLLDEEFVATLSRRARTQFALPPGLRESAPRPEAINELAGRLMQAAREHAERLACGEAAPRSAALSRGEEFQKVERFLHAVFRRCWPGGRADATIEEIERAFALFASGGLAFVAADESDAFRAKLNAEPDSAYFFAFAEFALTACSLGGPRASDWFSFARLFVALEDVFMAKYGAPARPRDLDLQYLREQRSAAKPLAWSELEGHLDRFRKLFPNLKSLANLKLAHTINVLHAARDEIVKSLVLPAAPAERSEDE